MVNIHSIKDKVSGLKICHWNVGGLKGSDGLKINDGEFKKEIVDYDFIAFTETHLSNDTKIGLEGYYTFQVDRPRNAKASKDSGGIAVLIRNNLKNGVAFYRSDIPDIVWVKLRSEFFNLQCDIFIGVVYMAPRNSTYSIQMKKYTKL